ncbi:hypothetical protein C8N46_106325 [Kordia periserrulae]|uniref:Uncharacterized protein n=1 Tax=Kordia periserrulae TaxID=701523 RepID=A0A2T6BX78_9FLAO|nr:hypothetical protein [Kordia periserrulae]PTX60679.1 hypothetical protein C8N46_106325 [Kordia periserrulae]
MRLINKYRPSHIRCPYFLSEDKVETMQRYRIYVNEFNAKLAKRNKEVKQYNKRVAAFIAEHGLEAQALTFTSKFKKQKTGGITNSKLSTSEYNKLVGNLNTDSMLLLYKETYLPIRQQHEGTFEVILWLYSQQLRKLRKQLQLLSSDARVAFPKVHTNSYEIANFTKDGVPRVLYCRNTIRNHIKRLYKAGIFEQYESCGRDKPVNYFINEAIFVFRDKGNADTENQQVSQSKPQELWLLSVDTRTLTKEKRKKVGNVDNHSRKAEVHSFADGKNRNSYKNSTKDDDLKISNHNAGKLGARENFPKNELSEYLRGKIYYRPELLQALTEHHYDTYSYASEQMHRRLETESTDGVLSKEEFRELLLQLFVKIAAPIWKDKEVYYGSWHNALVQIDDEYLRNPNGSIPRKETLLYMFGLLIYRINRAKRFFRRKKEYQIHFPCIYFDSTRKRASEGGFAYTVEWLKQYQKYQDMRVTRRQQNTTKAGARRRTMTAVEKVRMKIKKYIKGEFTLPQVYHYIEHNRGIPNYFVSEVPRILNTLTHKEFELYEC